MHVLSIKVPIQKKSGNLFNGPRISTKIYGMAQNRKLEMPKVKIFTLMYFF